MSHQRGQAPPSLYFSDHFGVSRKNVEKYGAFDISPVADLPLFVDPFLLFASRKPKYRKLHDGIIDYLKFLKTMATTGDLDPALRKALYSFQEVKENWLGFTRSGNRGAGLGAKYAGSLHANLHSIFGNFGSERITKGSHLEKLCLIDSGVGRDRISDFTTRLILEFLCSFTERFTLDHLAPHLRREFSVPRVAFNYEVQAQVPKRFTLPVFKNGFILLTPSDLLTKDETWINRQGLFREFHNIPEAIGNDTLRAQMNDYFMRQLPKEPKDEDVGRAIDATIRRFPELVDYYIRYKEDHEDDATQDPHAQLQMARNAVFRSWHNPRAKEYRRIYDIPDAIGTAVNVQMMVFGNSGDRSATGVGFTRNPATGAKEFYGEFLVNAQGEDVVAGIRTPRPIRELADVMPKAYAQLRQITTRLEKHYKDIQDFEFTIQDDRLFMLQTRSGKRTGYAAVVIATDLMKEKLVTPKEALLLVDPEALLQLLAPGFDPKQWKSIPVATKGLPASPGAACGQVVFTSDQAVAWTNQGKPVILVRRETVPDDIHGMWVAQGILTATGGMTSHAAVVGRQMGKPSIVGAGDLAIDEHGKTFSVKGQTVKEGDWVAFDGLTGEVKLAKVAAAPSEILQVVDGTIPAGESDIYRRFTILLEQADKVRRLGVRANADQPDQAEIAYKFGARGIGLCRTEHMFFGEGRIPIVQRMILADNETIVNISRAWG